VRALDPDAVVAGYEASVPAAHRRARGVHFTPPDVADGLAALALAGLPGAPLVCDPACGAGAMLLAAGRALEGRGLARRHVARELLWGLDADAAAVAAAREAIAAWAGIEPGEHLVVGDGLRAAERWPARFDAVLGNPPFLNQLERATVRDQRVPRALAHVVRPYTDTAWLFLAAAPRLVRPGGTVVLIQPQSVASARDAGPVRAAVAELAALEGMWSLPEQVFAASVLVCAPVLRVGGPPPPTVARWTGRCVEAVTPAATPTSRSWSAALLPPDPPPPVTFDGRAGTLATIATATAGFRDQFYGLAPFAIDSREGDDIACPRLITTGLIEPNRVAWGERAVRFAGTRYEAPRIDRHALHAQGSPALVRWVEARLVPKVVVATQTKVVEAAVDLTGTWVPSTPVIAIHAAAADLWLVAAALSSPPVSAWAAATYAGAALSAGAIKLSATQVLQAPLPVDRRLWHRAASALAAGEVRAAAELSTKAYAADDPVLTWWANRLPPPP
jgi:SAM-dependent methyltransferase